MVNYSCRPGLRLFRHQRGITYMTGEEFMDHRTTVLIADSSEDFCAALTGLLSKADGFHVIGSASDGEQAIRSITQLKPDILILDLMLSKQDGISVLKAISNMEKKPATLATSRFITDYVANVATNLGVRYMMLKPFDMGILVERLEELRGGDLIRLNPQRRPEKNNIENLVT